MKISNKHIHTVHIYKAFLSATTDERYHGQLAASVYAIYNPGRSIELGEDVVNWGFSFKDNRL